MKNSKEKIISELKNKISEFKSKIKSNKANNSIGEDDITNMQININTIKNYYKIQKEDNINNKIDKNISNENILKGVFKENKNDNNLKVDNCNSSKTFETKNIIKDIGESKINNFIKEENKNKQKLRANSTSTSNFAKTKNYINFDINDILKQNKNPKKEKSEINFITLPKNTKKFLNFDELVTIHKNKKNNFIKLNLSSKKSAPNLSSKSNTDRNYRILNFYNNNTNENNYEENFSEPNAIVDKNDYNYLKLQTKLSNFMNEISLGDKNNRSLSKNKVSLTKPAIKNDKSKYNLNFLSNYDNNKENLYNNQNNKNINYKILQNNYNLGDILNSNINENKEDLRYYSIGKNSTLYNVSTVKNNNLGKTNNNIMKKLKNRTLSNFFDFNNSNKYSLNIYDNRKNNNSAFDDINKVKFYIKNLSNDDINNLPFSVYKEIKELYDLMHIKFFKNN